jgi:hypothetical protein
MQRQRAHRVAGDRSARTDRRRRAAAVPPAVHVAGRDVVRRHTPQWTHVKRDRKRSQRCHNERVKDAAPSPRV